MRRIIEVAIWYNDYSLTLQINSLLVNANKIYQFLHVSFE